MLAITGLFGMLSSRDPLAEVEEQKFANRRVAALVSPAAEAGIGRVRWGGRIGFVDIVVGGCGGERVNLRLVVFENGGVGGVW